MLKIPQSDLLSFPFCNFNPVRPDRKPFCSPALIRCNAVAVRLPKASHGGASGLEKRREKCSTCTADELHYVSVSNSDWRLALWRYLPSPQAPSRNHPLLLLSGVATNATGYDLAPESSFARYMSGRGFDTWILELRGAGLSTHHLDFWEVDEPLNTMSRQIDSAAKHGKTGQYNAIASQLRDFSQRLIDITEEAQQSSPIQFSDLHERFATTLEEIQKRLDLIVRFNWDFDHYLEEDLPATMEYIRTQSKPKDGKLLAIGHSMGGILLYAMLSRCSFNGIDPRLASVATLASSLDYTSSKSSLKLLLPLTDPVEALNVPVPIGTLLAAAHPFASRPPYVLSWLTSQISAKNMMHPKLLEKLVMNNFGTVPAKLLLQLSTVFRNGGLCDRTGTFYYKDHLNKGKVPVLALSGDQDLICPTEAVYETVKLIPEHLVTYKVLGEPGGPHYGHYDLVGSLLAAEHVYPLIIEFLNRHDTV